MKDIFEKVYRFVLMRPGENCDIIALNIYYDRETVEQAVDALVEKSL